MTKFRGTVLCLLLLTTVVSCNDTDKGSSNNMLGEKEAVLIEAWGQPDETSGKDFDFFEPYSKPKTLYYKRKGRELAVQIKQGIVFSISLVPPLSSDEQQ